MPSWRDYYLTHDQTPHYEYLRTVLQVLQWLRGGERWVLKSPQHLEQFPALRTTFPDATFVVTHRDPVSVTASVATMITYTARMSHERVDPNHIGGYWADRIERMLHACVDDRDAAAGRPVDRRALRRVHGRRLRHGRADLRPRRPADDRQRPRPRCRRSWPTTRAASSAASSTTSPTSASTPPNAAQALRFYTDRFGVTEET